MSPTDLAKHFWDLSDAGQAAFFNALDLEVVKTPSPVSGQPQEDPMVFHSQMVSVAHHPSLTAEGAWAMETIGRAVARRVKAQTELEELDAVLEVQRRVLADPKSTREDRAAAKDKADELLDLRRTMGVLK
jgi:hypothetical protein